MDTLETYAESLLRWAQLAPESAAWVDMLAVVALPMALLYAGLVLTIVLFGLLVRCGALLRPSLVSWWPFVHRFPPWRALLPAAFGALLVVALQAQLAAVFFAGGCEGVLSCLSTLVYGTFPAFLLTGFTIGESALGYVSTLFLNLLIFTMAFVHPWTLVRIQPQQPQQSQQSQQPQQPIPKP